MKWSQACPMLTHEGCRLHLVAIFTSLVVWIWYSSPTWCCRATNTARGVTDEILMTWLEGYAGGMNHWQLAHFTSTFYHQLLCTCMYVCTVVLLCNKAFPSARRCDCVKLVYRAVSVPWIRHTNTVWLPQHTLCLLKSWCITHTCVYE